MLSFTPFGFMIFQSAPALGRIETPVGAFTPRKAKGIITRRRNECKTFFHVRMENGQAFSGKGGFRLRVRRRRHAPRRFRYGFRRRRFQRVQRLLQAFAPDRQH